MAELNIAPIKTTRPETLLDLISSILASVQEHMSSLNFFGVTNQALGYFDVLVNSIDIMQEHIIRSRLAGEPPHR
ncbi:MAG: hypothetical protein MO846_00815 [Candidatus Devosia symbiotica]|nr:hypothetical protein [Candidatus Devosia symbiotica]